MLRAPSPIVQFFLCQRYLTGLFSGCLITALLVRFQHYTSCSIPACPDKQIFISEPIMTLIESQNNSRITAVPFANATMTATNAVNNSLTNATEIPSKRERILCWVVTSPANKVKAEVVNKTWGRRCDKLLFMSSQNDSSLPVVGLPIGEESRQQLWNKAKLTFRYIYRHHLNDFDWFFKADDDTYAVIENMRTFLSSYNSSQPLIIGHEFGQGTGRFLSGGAGYILTRETLRLLVEKGLDQNICPTNYKGEEDDVTITQCLEKVGVTAPKTIDDVGHHRFLSCSVEQYYSRKGEVANCETGRSGMNCLSDQPITFHYVSGDRMLMYEYLIYQLKINLTRHNV